MFDIIGNENEQRKCKAYTNLAAEVYLRNELPNEIRREKKMKRKMCKRLKKNCQRIVI